MVGQFIGARRYEDAEKTVWTAFFMSMAFIGAMSTLTFLYGRYITHFFINDPKVIEVGAEMFKYVSFSIPFFGSMNIFISALNGAGKSLQATIANVVRLWGIRIPLVFTLSKLQGYRGIFIAMLISNVMAMVVAYLFYRFTDWKKGIIHED
jgi:Na+-driven multidrug efflux pump